MRNRIQTLKSTLFIGLVMLLSVAAVPLSHVDAAARCTALSRSACSVAMVGQGPTGNPGGQKGGGNNGNCANLNKCDLITQYVNPFINALSALVGVAVVVSIIIGGIQYSSSEGDPSRATAAKNRIRNAIVALITFILLYGMLNFLIPGGLV